MIQNENELTKNFPANNNPIYQTPKWVGWFNLIYVIAMLPGAGVIASFIYELKNIMPKSWQLFLNDQYLLIVILLYFPIIGFLIAALNYLNKNIFVRELFTGETGYIVADQEIIKLKNILEINAKHVPPDTKIYIYIYNRQQQGELSQRYFSKFERGYGNAKRGALAEADAQGIKLDLEQFPIMSLKKSEKHVIGNVNLIKTIDVPFSLTPVDLQQFLPDIDLKTVAEQLLKPSFNGDTLTELAIRVVVNSKNEFTAYFEVFINPMETAFSVEI